MQTPINKQLEMAGKARHALAVLLFCLAPVSPVIASEEILPDCKTKVSATGIPHKTKSLARLYAQADWLTRAKEQGADYAMWHNARDKSLSCKNLPRSSLIRCYASAKPCRAEAGATKVR